MDKKVIFDVSTVYYVNEDNNLKNVAYDDIYVFKICQIMGQSDGQLLKAIPYFYYMEETCESVLETPNPIKPWYNSYSSKCIAKKRSGKIITITGIDNSGIYDDYFISDSYLVLCIIPKGTTFYVNEKGEYISEYLKIEHIMLCPNENEINAILNKWQHS